MQQLNSDIFFFINNGWKHPVNDLWLGYASYLGNGFVIYPAVLLLLVWIDRKNFWRNAGALLITGLFGGIAVNVMKSFLAMPRPLAVFEEDIKAGKVAVVVMFEPLYTRAFPSGHTQTVFTIATTFIWIFPRTDIFTPSQKQAGLAGIFIVASVVGLSRIYVGAHFPGDVLGGAATGILTALLGTWIYSRLLTRYSTRPVPTPTMHRIEKT